MKLKQLIKSIGSYNSDSNLEDFQVRGISCNSKNVQDGFIFVAISGTHEDGHRFIDEAISRGGRAVIVQGSGLRFEGSGKIPFIRVEDTRKALAKLSAEFYGRPSAKIKVIGVTGTNGKTTITYLIEVLLKEAGFTAGVIGTVNYRFKNKIIPSKNTTPGPIELQSMLADMVDEGVNYAVIEVSSHALDQDRIGAIDFHSAIFTNLTQDHLDYHNNLENYFQAKTKLFKSLGPDSFAIINNDDAYSSKLKGLTRARIITYGIDNKSDVTAENIKFDITHTEFFIRLRAENHGCKPVDECGQLALRWMSPSPVEGGPAEAKRRRVNIGTTAVKPWGSIGGRKRLKIKSHLIGRHNVYNILASIAWALSAGIKPQIIKSAIEKFCLVPGRLERIACPGKFCVFVDYAHTEDALTNAIKTLRPLSKNKVIVVFGCGGERDKTKRPKMGYAVTELADYAIITNDNPRSEDPAGIITDIKKGIKKENFCVMPDRLQAIKKSLEMAASGDIVLIAGKGHEGYQILNNKMERFDDREVVRGCLKSMKF